MATPVKQNLTAIRGDDFNFSFRLQKDGVPLPMTDKVGVAELRLDVEDVAPTSTFEVTLEPSAGRVRLFMPHDETARLGALPADRSLVFSVRLQNIDGSDRRTWMTGAYKITTVSTR